MKKYLLFAIAALASVSSAMAQYCTPAHSNACGVNYFLSGLTVTGTSFAPVMPTTCASTTATSYTFGNTAPDLLIVNPGQSYTINFTNGTSAQIGSLWIDWDQNQVFDASEWVDLGRTIASGAAVSVQFTVPASATPGNTGMRLRTRLTGNANADIDACTSFGSGLSYDFVVSVVPAQACSATPAQPILTTSAITICPGDSSRLSYSNPPLASGLTLLWQYSTDNGSSWQSAPGTNNSYSYMVKGSNFASGTQFRLNSTCNNTPGTVTSAPATLTLNPVAQCYCITNLHSTACVPTDGFSNMAIANSQFNVTPPTPCGNNYQSYGNATNELMVLPAGTTVSFEYTTGGAISGSLWVDWNKNGSFERNEWLDLGRNIASATPQSIQIAVPAGFSGLTRARVRTRLTGNLNDSTSACTSYGSGFTYDFNVSSQAPQACATSPLSVLTTTPSSTQLCGTDSVRISYSNAPLETGLVMLWQMSTDGGQTWAAAPGNNAASSYMIKGTNVVASGSWFRLQVSCSNGGAAVHSTPVQMTIKPLVDCYCTTNLHGGTCYTNGQIPGLSFNFAFRPQMPADCAGNTTGYFKLGGSASSDTLIAGIGGTYSIDLTSPSSSSVISLWIDYNANGAFEATEWTDLGRVVAAGTAVSVPVTIPSGLTPGLTAGRIRTRASGSANADVDACTAFFSGVTYDFPVKLQTTVTGLDQSLTKGGLLVYPNPTAGSVNVKLAKAADRVTFMINDLSGKTVSVVSPTQVDGGVYTLPLNLPAGTYILAVSAGGEVAHTKLVVR